MRKTIKVTDLIDTVNRYLAVQDPYMKVPGEFDRDMTNTEAWRMGAIAVLERFLMDTDNYAGYGFQDGIVNFSEDNDPDKTTFGDQTRRVYYTHTKLKGGK